MLEQETINKIRSSFPEESVQVKKTFKDPETGQDRYLTGYKPQYIIERLNDAFGHDCWDFEIVKFDNESNDFWVLGRLSIYTCKYDEQDFRGPVVRSLISIKEQFGNMKKNTKTDFGDVLKGAATNALEKCASLLDVGHEAYKGLVPIPGTHPEKGNSDREEAKGKLLQLCKKHNINKEAFKSLIQNVLKKEGNIETLSVEEINKLSEHLEKNGTPF